MKSFLRELHRYRLLLTRQQFKTLRGQALSGNVEAAYKGLRKLVGA